MLVNSDILDFNYKRWKFLWCFCCQKGMELLNLWANWIWARRLRNFQEQIGENWSLFSWKNEAGLSKLVSWLFFPSENCFSMGPWRKDPSFPQIENVFIAHYCCIFAFLLSLMECMFQLWMDFKTKKNRIIITLVHLDYFCAFPEEHLSCCVPLSCASPIMQKQAWIWTEV